MKKLKHNETDLQTLKYYSKLHLHLVYTGMVLAVSSSMSAFVLILFLIICQTYTLPTSLAYLADHRNLIDCNDGRNVSSYG